MGFWSSFLGNMAAEARREQKRKEQEEREYEQMVRDLCDIGIDFNKFLMTHQIGGVYTDNGTSLLDGGRTALNAEKKRIEAYKKKINDYISMGGRASDIRNYANIDEYIAKLKYIKSVGYLDRQDEWIQMDMGMLKSLIKMDIQAKQMYQEALAQKAKQEQREQLAQSVGTDIYALSGVEFEMVCQTLIEKMGFTTETTKASGDGGIDIIAYNHQPLLSGKYIIQCKRYSGNVGEPIIRDLYGVVMSERANKGILMTTGHFSNYALSFANGKPLELIDGQKMEALLTQYSCEYLSSPQKRAVQHDNANSCTQVFASADTNHTQIKNIPSAFSINNQLSINELMGNNSLQGEYYRKWSVILEEEPTNIKARCKVIEIMHDCIAGHILSGDITTSDLRAASQMLSEWLVILQDTVKGQITDEKKRQYLHYMTMIIEGECQLWQGNLLNAIIKWDNVITSWDELNGTAMFSESLKGELILSVVSGLQVIGLYDIADSYRRTYIDEIHRENAMLEANASPSMRMFGNYSVLEKLESYAETAIAMQLSALDDASFLLGENGISFTCTLEPWKFSVDAMTDEVLIIGENAGISVLSGLSAYTEVKENIARDYFSKYL